MLYLKTFELGINSQNPGKQFVELMTYFIQLIMNRAPGFHGNLKVA